MDVKDTKGWGEKNKGSRVDSLKNVGGDADAGPRNDLRRADPPTL